jgi:hypothetical protein
MSEWDIKKSKIAKAREYIVLEYESRVLLQSKSKKGVAEKKLLNHLSNIWLEKGLDIANETVPHPWTIKRWYSKYRVNRTHLALTPNYGTSTRKSSIPESHQKIILNTLSTTNQNEPIASLIRKICNRLKSDPSPVNYSEATIRRFIKANDAKSLEVNRLLTPQKPEENEKRKSYKTKNTRRLVIEVIGKNMRPDESILAGDTLIVDKNITPRNGDYVLVEKGDEPGIIRWPPETPQKPLGVIVQIIRKYR